MTTFTNSSRLVNPGLSNAALYSEDKDTTIRAHDQASTPKSRLCEVIFFPLRVWSPGYQELHQVFLNKPNGQIATSPMQTDDSSPSQSGRSRSPAKSASRVGGDNGSSSAPRIETARPPPPWFTESYFSNEPVTAAARKVYHSILGLYSGILVLVIFSVLSIYWGALWQTSAHVHNLNGWVVVSQLRIVHTSCAKY